MKLRDMTAIVTGSAGGIGRAIALLFAAEGARVVLADLNDSALEETTALIKAAGGIAIPKAGDVADARFAECLVATAVESGSGRIDILVNNAGIDSRTRLLELEEEEWDQVLSVNLKSMYLLSRGVAKVMAPRAAGVIVNTSSVCGLRGGGAGVAYTTSKHGVIGLTRALAYELGPSGIRVNAFCPGAIRTPMTESFFTDPSIVNIMQRVPLGRVGEAEDMARMALFLASADSGFVTGTVLVGDGGGDAVYPTALM